MNCAIDIERNSNVIFAGELTGSSPNFVGEDQPGAASVQRPAAELLVVVLAELDGQRSPDLDLAEPVRRAVDRGLCEKRDPGLEAIFEYIDSHQGDL